MKKVPTLFVRDPDDRKHVLSDVTPGCEWVLDGEGVATRKYDGTCVLVRDGAMFARREVKPGKQAPPDFELVEYDEVTEKAVGWVPVTDSPEHARHWEACRYSTEGGSARLPDGTYEMCGPKVNGNPEGLDVHILIRHGETPLPGVDIILGTAKDAAEAFNVIGTWLLMEPFEGIVWHHPDGRMAKLKRRDFAR